MSETAREITQSLSAAHLGLETLGGLTPNLECRDQYLQVYRKLLSKKTHQLSGPSLMLVSREKFFCSERRAINKSCVPSYYEVCGMVSGLSM